MDTVTLTLTKEEYHWVRLAVGNQAGKCHINATNPANRDDFRASEKRAYNSYKAISEKLLAQGGR